jgi:soluble lytic murein transglycosylase-like protein
MVSKHSLRVNTKITIVLLPLILGVAQAAPDLNDLIDALCIVESSNNPSAIGDGGQAVGILQIHPIMIKDVNRILGKDAYTLRDRLDPVKSRKICRVYLSHYGKGKQFDYLARIWNGGPSGWKKKCTEKYWLRVEKVLRDHGFIPVTDGNGTVVWKKH